MSTFDSLPAVGEKLRLTTHLHVRDDAMQLYGFASEAERGLFKLLISAVSGIGPKLALNVLSTMPVPAFCSAVVNEDKAVLSRVSGIGKRSAERLIVELREKVIELAPVAGASAVPAGAARLVEDAVSGLVTLGFKADAARKSVSMLAAELPDNELSAEVLIRQALLVMNK